MEAVPTEEPAPPRKKRDDDHHRTNEGKTIILFGLLLTDLVFNSTLEYDEWDSYPTMFGSRRKPAPEYFDTCRPKKMR